MLYIKKFSGNLSFEDGVSFSDMVMGATDSFQDLVSDGSEQGAFAGRPPQARPARFVSHLVGTCREDDQVDWGLPMLDPPFSWDNQWVD